MRKALRMLRSEDGMALVIVLLAAGVLTAMVVEFAAGVQRDTDRLYNWERLQRLSLAADSAISVAAVGIKVKSEGKSYTWPATVVVPPRDAFKDGSLVSLVIEDETGKFNLNFLVQQNGKADEARVEQFKRMLRYLDIDTATAERVVDWIDPDAIALMAGSETGARNAPLWSVEEILQVPGITTAVYDKLLPHVTVHGSGQVNINSASAPVLVGLTQSMSPEQAESIVKYRTEKAFEQIGSVSDVVGGGIALDMSTWTTVKSNAFKVTAIATSEDGLTRMIQAVVGTDRNVSFWREY